MTPATLLVETAPEGYAVVTLNRPQAMNALSRQLRLELSRTIDQLEADPVVRVLILTGAGRAFCAGLDLKELANESAMKTGDETAVFAAVENGDPVSALGRFSGPVIGAINGAAITGGFELALACDVLLAAHSARFADTHARVGVMPGWGLSQKLSRVIGIYRAKELSLTGNFLSAQQAQAWGLVNRVVSDDQLLPQARALATDMLGTIPRMLVAYKKVIDDGFQVSLGDALMIERERAQTANGTVTAAQIAQRRAQVTVRGRQQNDREASGT